MQTLKDFLKMITPFQRNLILIMFSMLLLMSIACGYRYYKDYQNEKIYKEAFYFSSINVNGKDYHIEYNLIPLKNENYIGILNFSNDTSYVLRNSHGQIISFKVENTTILYDDNIEPFVGYEYVPHNIYDKNKIKRIIVIPRSDAKLLKLTIDK